MIHNDSLFKLHDEPCDSTINHTFIDHLIISHHGFDSIEN